ncbi:hypothetical protein AGMMS49928_06000 [Spirochaetia bacterium]|nr:hypothetical protein AGMMS49928_06000 [Spirochaetia bacterium]
MPYTHYNTDERKRTFGSTLQAMGGMGLSKSIISVILGKHLSSIYRETSRNRTGSVYTGNEAQAAAVQRRVDNKPSPRCDDSALMSRITALFKKDISPEQISGRLAVLYPDDPGKQASPSTIYTYLYRETAKNNTLKVHFRQKHLKLHKRSGVKDRRGQIIGRVSIDERPKIVEEKSRIGDWEGDTVENAGKTAYIATFVDRKSKLLLAK